MVPASPRPQDQHGPYIAAEHRHKQLVMDDGTTYALTFTRLASQWMASRMITSTTSLELLRIFVECRGASHDAIQQRMCNLLDRFDGAFFLWLHGEDLLCDVDEHPDLVT